MEGAVFVVWQQGVWQACRSEQVVRPGPATNCLIHTCNLVVHSTKYFCRFTAPIKHNCMVSGAHV